MLKTHTYSQLYLLSMASKELFKKPDEDKKDDGINFNGPVDSREYLNYLSQSGLL